ncbi:MAG TPA: exodeoxyribonuclease VII small subunit [Lachnospiraceae bacterium]|nr:exodeoxyribonuclease VII small subunit [Lachnospiraceae bacterium]
MAEEKKDEEFRLEEAFEQIERILERSGDKDVSLEESFSLYQEGMRLLKLCNARIDQVEKKMLLIDEEGGLHEFS